MPDSNVASQVYADYSVYRGPYPRALPVTPSDATNLPVVAQSLYVGGAGSISVVTAGGDQVTFASVPAGTVLPVAVRRVRQTGTTATNILALH